ncbi:hypothetical protein DFH09DRAFT_1174875 [Mycena vulgaris]|nr:hypothetical protein DFH09DRAFT_1174875 [Mycena vulgaris]
MPSLPDLPTELLIEIVNKQFSGTDTLRALSQTCRALRSIFIPVLWERVLAGFNTSWPRRKIKRRSKMLEGRMIGIQKTPYILPHIHSLSVTLVECNMDNWQPMAQFIRVLQRLPALRSLTIMNTSKEMIPVLSAALHGLVFPSLVSLVLPDALAPILYCFPNVQTLTYQDPYNIQILDAAKNCCEHIHTINNISLSGFVLKHLRESIPRVKRLSLWRVIRPDAILLLEDMDNLSELVIRYRPSRNHLHLERDPPLAEIIAAAIQVLRSSKSTGRKEVRIQHLGDDISQDIIQEETVFIF